MRKAGPSRAGSLATPRLEPPPRRNQAGVPAPPLWTSRRWRARSQFCRWALSRCPTRSTTSRRSRSACGEGPGRPPRGLRGWAGVWRGRDGGCAGSHEPSGPAPLRPARTGAGSEEPPPPPPTGNRLPAGPELCAGAGVAPGTFGAWGGGTLRSRAPNKAGFWRVSGVFPGMCPAQAPESPRVKVLPQIMPQRPGSCHTHALLRHPYQTVPPLPVSGLGLFFSSGLAHPVPSLSFPYIPRPLLSLSPNPRPQPCGSSYWVPGNHKPLTLPNPAQPKTWGRGSLDCGVGSLGTNYWLHPPGP